MKIKTVIVIALSLFFIFSMFSFACNYEHIKDEVKERCEEYLSNVSVGQTKCCQIGYDEQLLPLTKCVKAA